MLTIFSIQTSVDPLAEKYYYISPYAYCGNNQVMYVDPNGKEKIRAYDRTDPRNANLIKAANNFKDDKNTINIWAHGNSESILIFYDKTGTQQTITNFKYFETFLNKNSKLWQSRGKDEQMTIVLHSCETGQELYNKQKSIARQISKLKNTTIIAPNQYLAFDSNGEIGVFEATIKEDKIILGEEARWIEYNNGEQTNTYRGNSKQGSESERESLSPFWQMILNLAK